MPPSPTIATRIERIRTRLAAARRRPRCRWRMRRGRLRGRDEAAVAAVEHRLRIQLPADFAAFVSEVDHGGYGPGYGLLDTAEWGGGPDDGGGDPAAPCPLSPGAADPTADGWLAGTVPIVSYGCAFETRLVVTGEHRGRVVSVDLDGNLPPRFPRDADFLAWYERWLDELREGRSLAGFGWSDGGSAAELLARLREAPAAVSRCHAADDLARLPRCSAAIAAGLRQAVRDSADQVRGRVLAACARFRIALPGDVVATLLLDRGVATRRAVAVFAARVVPAELRAAIAAESDPDTFWQLVSAAADADILQLDDLAAGAGAVDAAIRRAAVFYAGRIRGAAAVQLVGRGLDDPEPMVRVAAVQALRDRLGGGAGRLLRQRAVDEPDALVRDNLTRALHRRHSPLHLLHRVVGSAVRWAGRRNARGI